MRKIKFSKLLNFHDTYPLEIQFEVFRWMISTGWEFRERAGVFEWLYGLSSTNSQLCPDEYGFNSKDAIDLHSKLKLIFLRAIVSESSNHNIVEWRKKEKIFLGSSRFLNLNINDSSDSNILRSLHTLFSADSKLIDTKISLNSQHPEATNIRSISIYPDHREWTSLLLYGYKDNLCEWSHYLAFQSNATFGDFLASAVKELERITQTCYP